MSVYKLENNKLFYDTPSGYAYIKNPAELTKLAEQGIINPHESQVKVKELPMKQPNNSGTDQAYSTKMPVSDALKQAINKTTLSDQPAGTDFTGNLEKTLQERTAQGRAGELGKFGQAVSGIEDPLLRSSLLRQAQQSQQDKIANVLSEAKSLFEAKYEQEQNIINNAFSDEVLLGGVAPEGLPESYIKAWQGASTEAKRQQRLSEIQTSSNNSSLTQTEIKRMNDAGYNQLVEAVKNGELDENGNPITPEYALKYLNSYLPDYIQKFRDDLSGPLALPKYVREGENLVSQGYDFYKDLNPFTREEYLKQSDLDEKNNPTEWKKYYPEFNQ